MDRNSRAQQMPRKHSATAYSGDDDNERLSFISTDITL